MMRRILILFNCFFGLCLAVPRGSVTAGGYKLSYYGGESDDVPYCEAISACTTRGHGSRLVKIDSESVQVAIQNLISPWAETYTWIGATDHYSENFWTWLDGTTLSSGYTNWAPDEPNDQTGLSHCGAMAKWGEMGWDDVRCDNLFGYICQEDVAASDPVMLTRGSTSLSRRQISSYWSAQAECERRKTRLIQVDHYNVFKMVQNEASMHPGVKFWVGEGNLVHGEVEKCPAVDADRWGYYNCSEESFQFICEAVPPHNLQISDEHPAVDVGGNIEIDCTALGFPLPDVSWYKGDEFVPDQTTKDARSTVRINGASDSEGRYTCIATNNINGQTHTATGTTHVEVLSYEQRDDDLSESESDSAQGCLPELQTKWMIPVIVILFVLVAVQFVALCIISARRSPQPKKSAFEKPVGFANPTVFSLDDGQKL